MQKRSDIQRYFSRPYETEPTQRFLPSDIVSEIEKYTYTEHNMIKEMLENIFEDIKAKKMLYFEGIIPDIITIYHKWYGHSIMDFINKYSDKIEKYDLYGTNYYINFDEDLCSYLFGYCSNPYAKIGSTDQFIYPYLGYKLIIEGYVEPENMDIENKDTLFYIFKQYIESFRKK